MHHPNRLARTMDRFLRLPVPIRKKLMTVFMARMVPYVGTSKAEIHEMTPERVVVFIPNHKKVRNHIRGIHAAAMTLAAETASGFVVGMNVPDNKLPLIKSLSVRFQKRLKGALTVEAWLTPEQRAQMIEQDKGEVLVQVRATDEAQQEPILCEMLWAWVPKK